MQSLTRLTIFLCCLWIVTLLYGEMVAYWIPNWTCSWPHLRPSSPSSNGHNFVKVAVLADPQLVDWTSYGLPPKSLALEAAQFYTDLYMRRSFHLSILPFRPDFVIFLGDLFDGGSSLSDEEWKESLNRFEHIFTLSEKDGFQIPIYYVPGNRDIGFASFHSQYPKIKIAYNRPFPKTPHWQELCCTRLAFFVYGQFSRSGVLSIGLPPFFTAPCACTAISPLPVTSLLHYLFSETSTICSDTGMVTSCFAPYVYYQCVAVQRLQTVPYFLTRSSESMTSSLFQAAEQRRRLFGSVHKKEEPNSVLVIKRYEDQFGERNYQFSVGNVDFIVVDAQILDVDYELGKETSFSWDFVRNISNDATVNPKVLLTHIPLHHPNETLCGPHRSSPVINQILANLAEFWFIQYQNYLSEETSSRLLDLIRPILVLSGHDHDQCTMIHSTPVGTVKEHTVGTVSWLQGNLYPSFMLLSVVSSSNSINSEDAVSTQLCFLPKQAHIYFWYLMQFIATLILIITWPANGFGLSDKFMSYIREIKTNLNSLTRQQLRRSEWPCLYDATWNRTFKKHVEKITLNYPHKQDVSNNRGERGSPYLTRVGHMNSPMNQTTAGPSLVSKLAWPTPIGWQTMKIINKLFRYFTYACVVVHFYVIIRNWLLFFLWYQI
ncbi:hypothetical protein ZIOFF_065111 [Zingiber officinale]|uniref:Calcineurin-like phosphoesterase domain-containing protein n=1 Tax=Zingiber officinale TaxID=94328 RepID=A0A8J5EYE5_ZINOF|nr:hypothetical protein ZIOFF_065111 [Zingiber officinale]